MTGYERSDLLINGLGLLANFCALLFIAVQLVEGRRASRKANAEAASENERRARQATLDYYYNTFNRWRPYVDAVREQTGSASLYAEFETLAQDLARRRAAEVAGTSPHRA